MTAIALALAYLGTLAFAAWWRFASPRPVTRLTPGEFAQVMATAEDARTRAESARGAAERISADLVTMRDTLDTLALQAGLSRIGARGNARG